MKRFILAVVTAGALASVVAPAHAAGTVKVTNHNHETKIVTPQKFHDLRVVYRFRVMYAEQTCRTYVDKRGIVHHTCGKVTKGRMFPGTSFQRGWLNEYAVGRNLWGDYALGCESYGNTLHMEYGIGTVTILNDDGTRAAQWRNVKAVGC